MNNKDKQADNETFPALQLGTESTGAPEEFGLQYATAPHEKARCWDRQELHEAYRRSGKVGQAAVAVGLTRWAHDNWMRNDSFGYRDRFKLAHSEYCETIENMMDQRLAEPSGNRGSDVLLMFKMKAEMPEKYREQVAIVDTAATKAVLDELRKLGAPRVIEGTTA
jgi:hypothetical protein